MKDKLCLAFAVLTACFFSHASVASDDILGEWEVQGKRDELLTYMKNGMLFAKSDGINLSGTYQIDDDYIYMEIDGPFMKMRAACRYYTGPDSLYLVRKEPECPIGNYYVRPGGHTHRSAPRSSLPRPEDMPKLEDPPPLE